MKYEVNIKNYGIIHCIARCDCCDWIGDDRDSTRAKRLAREHVQKTGHSVSVETGTATDYTPV